MRKDKKEKKTGNNDIEKVDKFINTMISNYLRRKNIKSVTDLPEEQIEGLFKEIDKQFMQFADYDEEMKAKIAEIKQNILDLKQKIADEEFRKKMREDRSALEEGTEPNSRLKSMLLDNLKGHVISVRETFDNNMLKVNENIDMNREPQVVDIRDALRVVTVESFVSNTPERCIIVKPRGGIRYTQDEVVNGKVQKYVIQIKDRSTTKATEEIVYTNSFDSKKYAEDLEYRKKVDYLLSKENIEGSKKLGGYLGEISSDNRVFDDENNFAAIIKFERDNKKTESIIQKLKNYIPGGKGSNNGR